MFCFHDYKRPVNVITGFHGGYEGSGGSQYTRIVFFCPDCEKTVMKELDNVHMDVPTVEALFPTKVRPVAAPAEDKPEKLHIGSCYVGIIIGMMISLLAGVFLAAHLTN